MTTRFTTQDETTTITPIFKSKESWNRRRSQRYKLLLTTKMTMTTMFTTQDESTIPPTFKCKESWSRRWNRRRSQRCKLLLTTKMTMTTIIILRLSTIITETTDPGKTQLSHALE